MLFSLVKDYQSTYGVGIINNDEPKFKVKNFDLIEVYEMYPKARLIDKAPNLLFLHGFMGSHLDWLPIICSLNALNANISKYCRIHLINLPGHGGAKIGDKIITFDSVISALKQYIIRETSGPLIYIGYSMGGRIALNLAENHNTKGIFLESSSPGIIDEEERRIRMQKDSELLKGVLEFKKFLENWYELPLFSGIKTSADYKNHLEQKLRNDPQELQKAIQILSVGNHPHLWEKINNFEFPITYICGLDDQKYSNIGKKLKKCYKNLNKNLNINVDFIPNCSHNVHLQKQMIYMEKLNRFLTSIIA
ncbi:MAG: alpha/beta fold hydrolase [Oligoflexia bacterium]|nr:alpha/beta fold hydrolase [Oligoflexia bacterium]